MADENITAAVVQGFLQEFRQYFALGSISWCVSGPEQSLNVFLLNNPHNIKQDDLIILSMVRRTGFGQGFHTGI
jgi:hypothetical protein